MTEPLSLLLNRRSCHALTEPGPDGAALDLIFQAGLRAPDFLHLRPYRFLVAEGDGRERLGAAMRRAAIASAKSEATIERVGQLPLRAPVVITVVACPRPHDLVPEFDQILSAGCTVLMMQMAAQGLGFGGVWRSGWLMHDPAFAQEIGLAEGERIVGFLYLGTPAKLPPPRPPETDDPPVVWL